MKRSFPNQCGMWMKTWLILFIAVLMLAGCTGSGGGGDDDDSGDGANQVPQAQLTASATQGTAPLTVDFDASASNDPDGDELTFDWDFGDGASADAGAPTLAHTFETAGTYTVRLTVADPSGETDIAEIEITVRTAVPQTVNVPDVTGLTQSAADAALAAAGLVKGTVTEEHSDTVAQGAVIRQTPAADTAVDPGASVNLTVSLGPAAVMVSVPDVTGLTQTAAQTALTAAGLTTGTVTTAHSADVAADAVIHQTPAAGTSVEAGSAVNLVVSLGPEAAVVSVPDVTGMTESAAETALTAVNLVKGGVTEEHSDTVAVDAVIRQSPAAGTSVAEGSAVNLVVSLGPAPASVNVPDVTGMTESAAEAALTAVNLVKGSVAEEHSDTVAKDAVIRQTPAAGTSVAEGSAVDLVVSLGPSGTTPPPDPATVAPDLDPTVATTVAAATAFLYTGGNPIQTGVDAGTIKENRSAVIRGRVIDRDDNPLPGVTVRILKRPEFGQTLSRTDGRFDLAVNGGAYLTVDFRKSGFLPVQRQVKVPWQHYVTAPDVVMIAQDPQSTPVDLNAGVQAARSSVEEDEDGRRQATVVFTPGNQAQMVMADGSRQDLNSFTFRATEYTVGAKGAKSMPAQLPPNIAYTYALDFSADEALAAGAVDVEFDQPVYFYLENFLGFPAGINVPTGYYDETRGVWVPSESGRVIKILAVNGSAVDIDTDGDDAADDAQTLADLGFTTAEFAKLADLYSAGDTLWRVPIDHFSSWDCNYGAYPPEDADIPWFKPDKKHRPDPCKQGGSIIDIGNMALGERIPIVGVPFSLNYRSNRMPAYTHQQEIRIWDDTVSQSLERILVELEVAGREHAYEFEKDAGGMNPPFPESFAFTWDGLDAYGRVVQGGVPMIVRVGYVYDGVYEANERWGEAIPDDTAVTEIEVGTRQQIGLWNEWTTYIGGFDPRGLGLGGWNLDIHHTYDPVSKTLYLGDGEQRSAEELQPVVLSVAGTGTQVEMGPQGYVWDDDWDGKKATTVNLGNIYDIATGPDGSLYIAQADLMVILKVTPDGCINHVAGGGSDPFSNGIPATEAAVLPWALDVGPDESIYYFDPNGKRIRKISPDGIVNTIADETIFGANFLASQIAMAPDGNLYLLDSLECVVRRIETDGNVTVFAGTPGCGAYSGEGGRARAAAFNSPKDIALGPDGSLYVADGGAGRVLRIAPNGIIRTVAGDGDMENDGDGGPAAAASVAQPWAVAVDADNTLYIGCVDAVRKVAPNGIISTIVGGEAAAGSEEGMPAMQTELSLVAGLAIGPDRNVYFYEPDSYRVRKRIKMMGNSSVGNEISIADKDKGAVYIFDETGRHLRTGNLWTGAVIWQFEYDADGRLGKILDVEGDETVIEHDGSGHPSRIVPPLAGATTLSVDADGFLQQVVDPAGHAYQFTYDDASAGREGLLTAMTTPNLDTYDFEYDSAGRLTKDTNPETGFQELTRDTLTGSNAYRVTVRTKMDRVTSYEMQDLEEGGRKAVKTYPFDLSKEVIWTPDAGQEVFYVDGTVVKLQQGPDPRYGMQLPIDASLTETTPSGLERVTEKSREVSLLGNDTTDTITINEREYTLAYEDHTKTFTLTTPENRTKTTTFDDKGRVVHMQVDGMASLNIVYNANGDPLTIKAVDSEGNERSYTLVYDGDGFLQSITDSLTRTTDFETDPAGRTTAVILPDDDPGGRRLEIGYDANGNVTFVTPPGKTAHILDYTGLDKADSYDPPDVAGVSPDFTNFEYNQDGQVTIIDQPGAADVSIDYDEYGRIQSYTHGLYSVTAGYDENTAMLDRLDASDGSTNVDLSLTWDGFLPARAAWSGPFTASVQGDHNDDFRIASLQVNSRPSQNFSYDDDGLLTHAGALTIDRDPVTGLVTHTAVDDVTTDIIYNEFGETEQFRAWYGVDLLMQVDYAYDAVGRIRQLDETIIIPGTSNLDAAAYTYTYDAAGRLATVTKDGSLFAVYTYDKNSNRISYTGDPEDVSDIEYDAQDRLTRYGDAAYTYSDAGALQSKTDDDGQTVYDYDAVGNLRSVTLPDMTGIQYLIDGMDRRVGKKVDGSLAQGFIYLNQLSPIAALDANGDVRSEFVYGARTYVPQLMRQGGAAYRIISDHLGSPRLVVDTGSGAVVQRMDYDAFGRVLQDTSPDFQPFGFAGGIYDRDTGLVRFGARDYDPQTGRWTAKDPLLFGGGDTNLYSYGLADPVNMIDPTGLVNIFDEDGNLMGIKPAQFRRSVGRETLDKLPSSQEAADTAGAWGDRALDYGTMGMVSGKDLRQTFNADIVNECSKTYKKESKKADTALKGVFALHGVAGLKKSIGSVWKPGGAAEHFGDFHNTWDFSNGVIGSYETLSGSK